MNIALTTNIFPPLARFLYARGFGASPQDGERWNPFGERLPLLCVECEHDKGSPVGKVSATAGLPTPSIIARRGTDDSKPLFKIYKKSI